jgi:HEAT repeat protein
MDEDATQGRGINVTLLIFGAVVLLIAGLVFNSYRIKQGRIAGMRSADPTRQAGAVREMMQGFTNDGHVAEQLQGERPSVRAAAVRALLALATAPGTDDKDRRDAARLTVPFMKDSDQPIKDRAIQALTAMGPEISLAAATNALGDNDAAVKAGAQQVCQNLAPYSIVSILSFASKPGKSDGAEAALRKVHRVAAGNAFHEIAKKKNAPWITAMVFGRQAVRATERKLTGRQVYEELGKLVGVEKPLVGDPAVPVLGLVEYLEPGVATEEDQNNVISILDRVGDTRAVPYLIPRLEAPETRRAAVGALGRMADPRATLPLLRHLPTDETNRLEIVIALGRIRDPRAVDALIEHGLGSVSRAVRLAASDSLRGIGVPAAGKLIAGSRGSAESDPSFYRAEGAVRALGGMRSAAAVDTAVAALTHPKSTVREAAAEGLALSGDPRVIAPLIARFGDPEGRVSARAARSLAAFGDRAVGPLIQALAGERSAYWAAQAIGYIGPVARAPLERKIMETSDRRAAIAAAALLGELRDPRAVPVLVKARDRSQDPDFRFAAHNSILRLGGS